MYNFSKKNKKKPRLKTKKKKGITPPMVLTEEELNDLEFVDDEKDKKV